LGGGRGSRVNSPCYHQGGLSKLHQSSSGGALNLTETTGNLKSVAPGVFNLRVSNAMVDTNAAPGHVTFNSAATIQSELPLINYGTIDVLQGELDFVQKDGSGYSISQSTSQVSTPMINITAGATLGATFGTNITGGQLWTVGSGTGYLKGSLGFHGGDLYVAAAGYGSLNIAGNMTMDGGNLHASIDASTGQYDTVVVATGSTITLGGQSNLIVSTVGQPAQGTRFNIMWATTFFGNFATTSFVGYTYTANIVVDDLGGAGYYYQLTA
jgi:hypothetical protein